MGLLSKLLKRQQRALPSASEALSTGANAIGPSDNAVADLGHALSHMDLMTRLESGELVWAHVLGAWEGCVVAEHHVVERNKQKKPGLCVVVRKSGQRVTLPRTCVRRRQKGSKRWTGMVINPDEVCLPESTITTVLSQTLRAEDISSLLPDMSAEDAPVDTQQYDMAMSDPTNELNRAVGHWDVHSELKAGQHCWALGQGRGGSAGAGKVRAVGVRDAMEVKVVRKVASAANPLDDVWLVVSPSVDVSKAELAGADARHVSRDELLPRLAPVPFVMVGEHLIRSLTDEFADRQAAVDGAEQESEQAAELLSADLLSGQESDSNSPEGAERQVERESFLYQRSQQERNEHPASFRKASLPAEQVSAGPEQRAGSDNLLYREEWATRMDSSDDYPVRRRGELC